METYKQVKEEIKAKNKSDKLTKGNVIVLEQSYLKELIEVNGKCEKCPRIDNLTLDHIVPVDMLRQFGIDPDSTFIEYNLRVLCKPCNMFKGNRLDFSTKKTKTIFEELLNKIY